MIRPALTVAATLGALLFVAPTPAQAKADSQATFKVANQAYDKGSYAEARKAYESLLAAGVNHEVVFYNLGNTYFRQGQLGRAIWAFERARKLAPKHAETHHNLELARAVVASRVKDKVVGAQSPGRWQRLVQSFSLSGATWWFLLWWWLAFGLSIAALWVGRGLLRNSLLALAAVSLLAALVFGRLYLDRREQDRQVKHAIVLDDTVTVREGPRGIATKAFEIHAGLKVQLAAREHKWVKIRLANGLEGWVRISQLGEL